MLCTFVDATNVGKGPPLVEGRGIRVGDAVLQVRGKKQGKPLFASRV